jgi:hypothetical protein
MDFLCCVSPGARKQPVTPVAAALEASDAPPPSAEPPTGFGIGPAKRTSIQETKLHLELHAAHEELHTTNEEEIVSPHTSKALRKVHEHLQLMKCDNNIRKDLYGNILLCGGNAMLTGFAARMNEELSALAPPGLEVKIITPTNNSVCETAATFAL